MDKRQAAHLNKLRLLAFIFVLLVGVAVLPSNLCQAGMQELADTELAQIKAAGFATFDLNTTTGIARMDFNTTTVSTYTEINSLKMGYYGAGWDQDWSGASLGSPASDLVFKGLYIEAKFTDITNSSGLRQLEYLRIGTTDLTGTVSANFNSFSGDIGGTTYIRQNLGATTITSPAGGTDKNFYLSLDRTNGYQFYWGASATKSP